MKQKQKGKNTNSAGIFHQGTFSLLMGLMLAVSLLLINMTAAKLPSRITQIDISKTGLYRLSGESRETAERISQDTDIFWIVQSGRENSEIGVLLERYEDLNPLIHVQKVDPVVNPNFTDRYTSEIILDNSLIVSGGGRSRYISYNDIFTNSYDYYGQGETTTYFDGENKITSALDYVNSGILPKIYRVTGHGEAVLSIALEEAISRQNYLLENLSTLSLSKIPEDAECLLIAGPTSDLSEQEGEVLREFLADGGKLLAFTDYEHTDLPVLMSILEECGVEVLDGLVLEADPNMCYSNYPMQLLPGIVSHDITLPITRSGYLVIVPMAHGMKAPETAPQGVNISVLLRTSDQAYAKTGRISTFGKEAGDVPGPFALGIAAEKKTDSSSNARIVWYSTSQIINKEYDAIVNGVNTDLFLNSLGWLTENDSAITIHSKQISVNRLTVPSGAAARIGIVLIGVIPLLYLMIGIVISVRRRRR